jgi:autotransporter-associated beta strand protein
MALIDNDAETHTISSGLTLTIDSGGLILNSETTNDNKAIQGPGTLTAGPGGGYELIVHATGQSNATPHTVSAPITDNGANAVTLTKSGVQSLRLNGTNSYTGPTYVAQGTLFLESSTLNNNIGSSSRIVVHRGATLNVASITFAGGFKLGTNQTLAGNGTVVGDVTADASGTKIAPGTSIGQLNFTGDLTLTPSATYVVEIGSTADSLAFSGSGTVFTIGGATLQILPLEGINTSTTYTIATASSPATIDFSTFFAGLANGVETTQGPLTYTVTATSTSIVVNFAAVPEPTTTAVALLGLPALLRRRRR